MIACLNSVLRAGSGAARKYQPSCVMCTSSFGVSTRPSISAALTMAMVSPNSLPIWRGESKTLMISWLSSRISSSPTIVSDRTVRNRLDARAHAGAAAAASAALRSWPAPAERVVRRGARALGGLVRQRQRGDRGVDLIDQRRECPPS